MDNNKNNVPDIVEAIITYIIAAICIVVAITGYYYYNMDTETLRWLLGFAVALSGGRDLKTFFGR